MTSGVSEFACFFAGRADAGPCQGQLVRGHLLPRALLKREYRYGALLENGRWRPLGRTEGMSTLGYRSLEELIDDERSWVPMCGGIMGDGAHHGAFDQARKLRIAREDLPAEFIEYANELGLGWFVLRSYPSSSTMQA